MFEELANIYRAINFLLVFQVNSADDIPPPIIQIGPANQTLPKGSVAMLNCRAVGSPAPDIKWSKDGVALASRSRFVIVQSGTLKIDGKMMPFFVNQQLYNCEKVVTVTFQFLSPAELSCEFSQRSP